MSDRTRYAPGPARGARVLRKDGPQWTLILTRDLRHPPQKVWTALTDPEHLRQWAPFDADGNMDTAGATVKLTTMGAFAPFVSETTITRAGAPKVLEYSWGGGDMRWELEPLGTGTRMTLWSNIDRRYVAWGAAGWHICFDVLDHLLSDAPIGRITGEDALKVGGWPQLTKDYTALFAADAPQDSSNGQ